MAQLSTSVALDMTSANVFEQFGKELLRSGGKLNAFVSTSQLTVVLPKNKKNISDAIAFNAEDQFKFGTIKLPGGKTFFGPTSGTISDIDLWKFEHSKAKPGDNPYTQLKMSLIDIDINVSAVLKALLKYNPLTQTKDFIKETKALYDKILDGNDFFFGSGGKDVLKGFAGNDTMRGEKGDDTLFGDGGSDALLGGDGKDKLNGGDGNDRLTGGKGSDTLEGGGKGSDWAVYSDAMQQKTKSGALTSKGVTANLLDAKQNKGEVASGDKYGSVENLQGSSFDDVLVGNNSRNLLAGLSGLDTLTGGKGADFFLFSEAFGNVSADKVTDFNRGGGDVIGLDEDFFRDIGSVGSKDRDGIEAIKGAAFRANADGVALDKDDRIIFDTSDGKLWYDADGSDFGAASLIAELKGVKTLSASNLRVFDMDLIV